MCLAIPGKILSIFSEDDLLMGLIDFAGLRKKVCLAYTPDATVEDYVIVHVGFAISILNEERAKATLELLERSLP